MRQSIAALLLIPSVLALAATKPADPAQHIQPNSAVYIEPMSGFETDLAAAMIKKHVPLSIVDSKDKAVYIIAGTNETVKAGWAKTIFITGAPADHASITVKTQDGQMVWAYAWDKLAAGRGSQSAAEGIAKHLKKNMEGK